MNDIVSEIKNIASAVKNELFGQNSKKDAEHSTHTIQDRARLYQEMRSFSDFLPYSEWLEAESMILMDDLVSVGALWEVEMAGTEAMAEENIALVEETIADALSPITLNYLAEGQYVLSCYTTNDYTLSHDLEEIKKSVHPRWKGSALEAAYIDSVEKMFSGLESEQGLFQEGSEGAERPFRGGRRVPRLMLYRRVPTKKRNSSTETREFEIKELGQLRSQLEDALSGVGVNLKRMERENFYEFMVRWFNPNPSSTDGSVNDLLKANPCPEKELAALDGELALSFLFNSPRTCSEKGVVYFDGCPSRFIQVDRIAKIPKPAIVTGERESGQGGDVSAVFDILPPGSCFVQHIFFQAIEETEQRVDYIENNSRFVDERARLVNEEAKKTKDLLSRGKKLFKIEMGFYVTSLSETGIDAATRKISNVASQKLGLGVISPENNLFPVESYLRNLPFVQDPILDHRRRRGRLAWLDHSVSFLPFQGRKRGHEAKGNKRCMTTFNRGGEVLNIDPLNKESNAHMVLLGPTGTGKSATLNKTIIELLLFHNARLVIAEAGLSFDPLMDFLEVQGGDVQRVNINSGSMGKPIAPFAGARRAREAMVRDMKDNGLSEEEVITKVVSSLPFDDEECLTKERIEKELESTSREELVKDYLGECVMIATIMVTGGRKKEAEAFRLRDATHLAESILVAVAIADQVNEDLVRPEHVELAIRKRANDPNLGIDENLKTRLIEMADCMAAYTKPGTVRSEVLNKVAKPYKKSDCLHVELGIAQRDGYEDVLALAYLSLLNMVNDIAERKEIEGDDRPIYVITDEAHLILKHPMIAPIAIKIVRMWRKYGAWFLPATQDTTSFSNGAEAILVIGEMFLCLSPPEDEIEALTKLLALNEEQQTMIRSAKMKKHLYSEGVYINRARKTASLFRLLQPSFCLSVAGTDSAEKEQRRSHMEKYGIRLAGAAMVEAVHLDYRRGIISKEELDDSINKIVSNPLYQSAAQR